MKFRSPTETPIHVALTTGHTAVIPQEGVELAPMFHREAISRGAIPGSLTNEEALLLSGNSAANTLASNTPPPGFDRNAEIRKVIESMLAGSNEGDFNNDGKPSMAVVNKLLGFQASRSEVDAVWTAMEIEDAGNQQ